MNAKRRRVHLVLPNEAGGYKSICGQFTVSEINWRDVPERPVCHNCERVTTARGTGSIRMLEMPHGVGISVQVGGWTFTGSGWCQ